MATVQPTAPEAAEWGTHVFSTVPSLTMTAEHMHFPKTEYTLTFPLLHVVLKSTKNMEITSICYIENTHNEYLEKAKQTKASR